MLDLSLFSSRLFSASITSAVLNYIGTYSVIFLMPFYLIDGMAFSPAQAGLYLTALPITMAIVAPISGTLSDRIGARLPTMTGMALLAAGLFFLSRLDGASAPGLVVAALALSGLGIGIFISPNNSALMGAAPPHRQGIAAGLLATARNVGMVLGVGLSGAIFTTSLAHLELDPASRIFVAVQNSFSAMVGIALLGFAIAALRPRRAQNPAPA
jgi:MFS family permease